MATAAPRATSAQTSAMSAQGVRAIPDAANSGPAATASRRVGASRRTRSSRSAPAPSVIVAPHQGAVGPAIAGRAAEDALEVAQRLADGDALRVQPQLADGPLMRAGPILDDRDGLPHLAQRLEVAEQEDCIGQVG